MNFYCQSCFKKSEYKFSKPKFCPNCGVSLSNCKLDYKLSEAQSKTSQEVENSNGEKIKQLEKQIEIYKRISLSKRLDGESFLDSGDDQSEYPNDMDDDLNNSNIWRNNKNLNNSISVEYDKNKKFGTKFSDVMAESMSVGFSNQVNDFKNQNRDLQLSKEKKEKILKEIQEEASSAPRIINID
jgi:hypothetical protein